MSDIFYTMRFLGFHLGLLGVYSIAIALLLMAGYNLCKSNSG